jgi:hypothetical protein
MSGDGHGRLLERRWEKKWDRMAAYFLCNEAVCDTNQRVIGLGAQTSHPDDAGPVRYLFGGIASPAVFDLCQ